MNQCPREDADASGKGLAYYAMALVTPPPKCSFSVLCKHMLFGKTVDNFVYYILY